MSRHPATAVMLRLRGSLLLLTAALFALPTSQVRAAEPTRSAARLIPASGLAAYLEYDGLREHEAAWKASAAYEILNRTAAGQKVPGALRKALDQLQQLVSGKPATGADVLGVLEHACQRGFAVASYHDGRGTTTIIVLKHVTEKTTRESLDRVLRFLLQLEKGTALPTPVRFRGRDLYAYGDHADGPQQRDPLDLVPSTSSTPITWWLEGEDLVFVRGPSLEFAAITRETPIAGEEAPLAAEKPANDRLPSHKDRVASVLDTIDQKQANATTHPAYAAANSEGRDIDGFEPDGLFFARSSGREGVLNELGARYEGPFGDNGKSNEFDMFESIGLSQSEQIVGRWGFRGRSLVTDVRFAAPARWQGAIGMLNPAGFRKDRLPPASLSMGASAIGSFDRGSIKEVLKPVRDGLTAEGIKALGAVLVLREDERLRRLSDEVIGLMGPTWSIYADRAVSKTSRDEALPAVVVEVKDVDAFANSLRALAERFNAYVGEEQGADEARDNADATMLMEPLPAPDRGYRLISPANRVEWLTKEVTPTVFLGRRFVAFAANPTLARAALAGESNPEQRWKPTGELAKSFEALPANLAFMLIGNPRDSFWPGAIAALPSKGAAALLKFAGADSIDLNAAHGEERPGGFLDLVGAKGPRGQPRELKSTAADEIRSILYPSVTAATLDDRGLRLLRIEPWPLACAGLQASFKPGLGTQPMTIGAKFRPGR